MYDVIVCGSLHLDILVKAPALPRLDETVVGQAWEKICGGKGGNQAVQSARAGARTAMIGRVGDDAFGQALRANLQIAGVDFSGVTQDRSLGSGMSVAILQDDGEYGAVIVSGSNSTINAATLAPVWDTLGGAKILVLQNEVPHIVNVAAAQTSRLAGARVVYNAAPAREAGLDLLDLVDVLIVNRIEAEAMFGEVVEDRDAARQVLAKQKLKNMNVVITLGGEGLVVATETGEIVEIAPVSVIVTSTHGAGDCFVGVVAAQLALGETVVNACKIANQSAAEFVSRKV